MTDPYLAGWRLILVRNLIMLVFLAAPLAHAQAPEQAPAQEPALAWTVDDEALAWGPCPPFLPEGCAIAILHGDPAQQNVDIFFKAPAGKTLPLHRHTSAERMVLVAGELHVTYEGQDAVALKEGSYAYGPAGLAHSAACVSEVDCVLFIAFEAPLDAMPVEGGE